jgi:hypothetical protein
VLVIVRVRKPGSGLCGRAGREDKRANDKRANANSQPDKNFLRL